MLNKILSIGRNVRDLKQGESSMDPNCLVEKLSVSLQSYETTEVDSSNRLVAPGTLKPDGKIAHRSLCLELTSLMVARRKRSCFPRRARFSRWGSLHISNPREHRRPKEISGREGGQRNKNQRSPSPVRPKEERPASTSRIRLKVTLGKELVHSRMIDIKPVTGSGGKHCWGTRVESPKITKDIEDRFDEETMLPSDKEIIEKVNEKIADGIDGKPAQKELPVLEVAADNGCLDSETSPDSEVINLIPEDQISQKVPEVLYDISTTAGNASVNTSSSDTITMEPLPSSGVTDFRISTETLKVGSEGDLCCELGVHSELAIPEKFLPNNTKPKGHKSSKSSRSTTNGPDAPQSISSKGNSCKQKGNQSKRKVKEKRDDVNFIFREDNFSETGEKTFADIGVSNLDVSPLDMVPNGVQDQSVPQRNAWVSCDNCGKWRRIPVALADSIDETESRWICKDNVDKKFADCSILQEMSNAEINAELDISDASAEEDAGDPLPNSTKLGQKKSTAPQQPSWKLIKSNLFLHRTRKSQTIDEIMVCHCKAPQGGRMGCRGDECLNRMLNIECVKGTCPCGEFCSNQQFQKRKYAKLECFRSGKKGHGLKLLEDIRKGQFLIEYVGEVLDMNAYEGRQREYALRGHKHFYFMTLNGSEVIDACAKGNLGRFINHSCEPNCRTEKWMVNGEVCIGLFALRDIGKGEEVTFDYNYVRVFGAAAKKCVCGSTLCGGYIGGDPLNAEVVVQVDSDEEYPEPVMVCEDDDADFGGNMVIAATGSLDVTKTETAEKDDMGRPAAADEHLEVTKEMHALESLSKERLPKMESSIEMDGSVGLLPSMQTIMAPGDGKSEITLQAEPDASVTKETTIRFLNTIQRSENSSLTTALSKSSLDTTTEIMRKSKYGSKDRPVTSTVGPIVKTSNSSSPVKKGKPRKSDVNVSKSSEIGDKPQQPYKLNKIPEGSSNDPFEAVQVKLNELLNADGGISKRKDASRGYLKLLFLTAASGDRGNGEAIQSNRDLSMILDALLKTKSRTVLGDIINKNGLQMLHNIVKRYRKEFHKIPILRKLLKVLEYLAVREILTLEHITSGPHCAGVESFRESILSLTEHKDRQVHQIARNFRDKWIPWHIRKNNYMDRDVGRKDFNRAPSKCNNRLPASNSQSSDVGERSPEKPINRITQSASATTPVSSGCLENCSASCSSNGTNIRKRKSRWDQPAGSSPHKEPRFIQNSHLSPRLDTKNVEEDAPPGFSHLNKPLVSSSQENGIRSDYPVTGHPQERFVSRFPVSFGIPLPILQQFGMPQGENTENWAIAAGIPFQPYPPLPTYPRDRWSQWGQTPAASPVATYHHPGQNTNTPNASGTDPLNTEVCGSVNQQNFQQRRSSSNISERKFPRQSRWDSNNTNSAPPPWFRSRLDRGNMGNNPRTGANLPRGPYNLEQVNIGGGSCGNTFYHHPYHQN